MIKTYTTSQGKVIGHVYNGENILLLGRSGAGKTELLKDIEERYAAEGKNVIVAASTGIAASNLDGGRTIHSVLRWNPKKKAYDYAVCAELLKDADLLVIDEVSMLDRSIIFHIVRCLAELEKKPQLIFSGDFSQLPPVTRSWDKLEYPFENPMWGSFGLKPCFLNEVVRQADPEFKEMLEKARYGDSSCIPYFNKFTCKKVIEGAITLCARKKDVKEINSMKMALLPENAVLYPAKGETSKANFSETRIEKNFYVKNGMRVLALRNDPGGRYQNGSLGTVMDLHEDNIQVRFDNGNIADIWRVQYTVEGKNNPSREVVIEQFPLVAGYAITIHKSQGQTFDAVNIKAPDCWAPGQLYVALSRCRTVGGIHLMCTITEKSLIADPRVIEFYKSIMNSDDACIQWRSRQ